MGDRCHRCGEPITPHFVGDDYCRTCKVELRVREESDARRAVALRRFHSVKDLTPRRRRVLL